MSEIGEIAKSIARLEERQEQDSKRIEDKLDRIDANTSKLQASQDGQLRRHSKDIDRLKQSEKRRTWLMRTAVAASVVAVIHAVLDLFAGQ